MKRRRRLPHGVVQGLRYFPGKLGSTYGMGKHRPKGRGQPRRQTVTLAKVGGH
jgi:hypothetical protein